MSVRITVTDKNPRAGDYMTLSHCWGAAQLITLRKDNLAELRQGIQLTNLPKTFQDAVAVARWFQIRYLWVDSLCILQDSEEDWVKESAMMRSVYSHSIMNISATGAADPSMGCFLDRNADHVRPFSALLSDPEIEYICFNEDFWRANISDAPLSKRAWVCQERLLSPRILHFGAAQMSWECMELASCETFPEGIPKYSYIYSYIEHHSSVISKRDFIDHTQGFSKSMWNKLVTYYTGCAMTVPSDIYMAFAGIAEEIHSITADEYIVGFWRKDLEHQLLWERESSATCKPTGYRAPSWSWFSANGAVCPGETYRNYVTARFKVLDVNVHHSAEGLYGPVSYGCLKCQGILGPAVCQNKRNQEWLIQRVHGRRLEGGRFSQICKFDHSTDLSEREVTCLPILVYEGTPNVQGLLLEPTHMKEEEYHRVGTFSVEDKANCRTILSEQTSEKGIWVDRPRKTFTIV